MVDKQKVLIIDDEESVCDILKKLFVREGYKALSETDPKTALEVFKKEKPDCVLLDIKMPGKDGLELLREIKAIEENTGIIIITGYGTLENAIESVKLGAFDYITKPFDLEYIKDLVENCLKKKSNHDK